MTHKCAPETSRWRDGTGYPDPKSTSTSQWAWEFLRRNQTYHLDVQSFNAHRQNVANGEDAAALENVGAQLARKWGLALCSPPDPTEDQPVLIWIQSVNRVRQVTRAESASVNATSPAIEFDLTLPLEPQFERARRLLIARQRRMVRDRLIENPGRRMRRSEYPHYLRVLDALDEFGFVVGPVPQVAVEHIGEALFRYGLNDLHARDESIRAMVKVSRQLRDGGYLCMPV